MEGDFSNYAYLLESLRKSEAETHEVGLERLQDIGMKDSDQEQSDSEDLKDVKDTKPFSKNLLEPPWKNLDKFLHSSIPTLTSSNTFPHYNIECPYPIRDPLLHSCEYRKYIHNIQPLRRSTREINCLLGYYKKHHKDLLISRVSNDATKFMEVPNYVLSLGENPQQNLFPPYNTYYNGGVLDCISFHEEPVLLSIHGDSVLWVNEVSEDLDLKEGKIYSLKGKTIDSILHALIRRKNKVELIRIGDLDDIDLLQIWKAEVKSTTFNDVLLDPCNNKHVCTLESDRTLKIREINGCVKYHRKMPKCKKNLCDDLSQAIYVDTNTIVIMDRNELNLVDMRTKDVTSLLYKKTGAVCDDLCQITQTEPKDIFVTSRHNLIKIDLRNTEHTLVTMTHLLKSPPLITTHTKLIISDVFCLSGIDFDDKVLITSNNSFISPPQYVPDVINPLRREFNLSKAACLEPRLQLTTIGAKLWMYNDDDMVLYTQTAMDVFAQRLSEKQVLSTNAWKQKFATWIEKLPVKENVLHYTEMVNFKRLMETLKNSEVDNKYLKKFRKDVNMPALQKKLDLNISKDDEFGQRFLAIWNEKADVNARGSLS